MFSVTFILESSTCDAFSQKTNFNDFWLSISWIALSIFLGFASKAFRLLQTTINMKGFIKLKNCETIRSRFVRSAYKGGWKPYFLDTEFLCQYFVEARNCGIKIEFTFSALVELLFSHISEQRGFRLSVCACLLLFSESKIIWISPFTDQLTVLLFNKLTGRAWYKVKTFNRARKKSKKCIKNSLLQNWKVKSQ